MDASLTALGLEIFDVGAFLDKTKSPEGKGFKLKLHEQHPEAPLSPFYLNLRTPDNKEGPLTPEVVEAISKQMYRYARMHGLVFDYVVGVPRAGEPFAQAFVELAARHVRLLTLGKAETGDHRMIVVGKQDKELIPDSPALLLDDLVTRADSKLEAIACLEEMGLVVGDVLVLLDRQQGGKEQLADASYSLHSLFTIRDLLDLLREENRITSEIHGECLAYLKNN